ncbi:MAG: hypothetical protein DRI61_16470, partial [Chloroflexi bacterium]
KDSEGNWVYKVSPEAKEALEEYNKLIEDSPYEYKYVYKKDNKNFMVDVYDKSTGEYVDTVLYKNGEKAIRLIGIDEKEYEWIISRVDPAYRNRIIKTERGVFVVGKDWQKIPFVKTSDDGGDSWNGPCLTVATDFYSNLGDYYFNSFLPYYLEKKGIFIDETEIIPANEGVVGMMAEFFGKLQENTSDFLKNVKLPWTYYEEDDGKEFTIGYRLVINEKDGSYGIVPYKKEVNNIPTYQESYERALWERGHEIMGIENSRKVVVDRNYEPQLKIKISPEGEIIEVVKDPLLSQEGSIFLMNTNTAYDLLADFEPVILAGTLTIGAGELAAAGRIVILRTSSVIGRSALTAEEIAEATAAIRASTIGARIGLPASVRTATTWSAINAASDISYAVISGEKLPSQGDLAVSQVIGFGEGLFFHGLLRGAGYTAEVLKESRKTTKVTEPLLNWANNGKLNSRILGWPVRAAQDKIVPVLIEYNRVPAQITLDSSEGALSFIAVGPAFAGIKAGLWDSLIVPLFNKELPHWAGITGPKGERDLSLKGQLQALALHAVDSPKFGRWFAPFVKVFQLPGSAVRDVPLVGEPLYAYSTDIGIVGWSRITAQRLLGQSWREIAANNIAKEGTRSFVFLNPDSLAFFAVYTSGVDTLLEKTGIAPSSDAGMILGQLAFILIPSYSGSVRDRVAFPAEEIVKERLESETEATYKNPRAVFDSDKGWVVKATSLNPGREETIA